MSGHADCTCRPGWPSGHEHACWLRLAKRLAESTAARLTNDGELLKADAMVGEMRALLEAYRSLAYAANALRNEAGSGKPYSQIAHILIAFDAARATVANLEGREG